MPETQNDKVARNLRMSFAVMVSSDVTSTNVKKEMKHLKLSVRFKEAGGQFQICHPGGFREHDIC